jgi:hypothetical protein
LVETQRRRGVFQTGDLSRSRNLLKNQVTNWLYNNFFGGAALTAQDQALTDQIKADQTADYSPGGKDYTPENWAYESQQVLPNESAAQDYATAVAQQTGSGAPGTGPGLGAVLKDILVIGAIGALLWAFFKFGGVNAAKKLAARGKYWTWGIVGGVALLAWYL